MSASLVIDFHVHVGYDRFHPWVVEYVRQTSPESLSHLMELRDPTRLRDYLRKQGVDFSVVLAEIAPITTGVIENEYVLQVCEGIPEFIPFACINPFMEPDPPGLLERLVKRGVRGLKLYPSYQQFAPNEARFYPLYEAATRLGVPIMFHTGSSVFRGSRLKFADPLLLDDVAVDFPGLGVILAHCGRPLWYETAALLARVHENVYLEVSGLPPKNLLTYLPRLESLASKVLFGSDFPAVPSLQGNIQAIRDLGLGQEASEAILWGNAARLLRLNRSAAA